MRKARWTWEQLREMGISEDVIEATKKALAEGREWTLEDMFPNQLPPKEFLDLFKDIVVDSERK